MAKDAELLLEAVMSSKQTRRSISVRGATYEALRGYCDAHQKSMSEIVEELLEPLLRGSSPTEVPTRSRVVAAPQRPRAVAHKVARAPQPVAPARESALRPQLAGRPAPTPAAKVVARRSHGPKSDYRNIQF